MVQLIFALDDDALSKPGVVRSIYDPTAGTGGMLSVADEYLRRMNPGIQLSLYGQDYNDALVRDLQSRHGHQGPGRRQHRPRRHPHRRRLRRQESSTMGSPTRPSASTGRTSAHTSMRNTHGSGSTGASAPELRPSATEQCCSSCTSSPRCAKKEDGGSRVAIVLTGSPLFSGGAGGGESNIRKWLLDNDPRRGGHRAAERYVLQHRYLDVHLGAQQPQE